MAVAFTVITAFLTICNSAQPQSDALALDGSRQGLEHMVTMDQIERIVEFVCTERIFWQLRTTYSPLPVDVVERESGIVQRFSLELINSSIVLLKSAIDDTCIRAERSIAERSINERQHLLWTGAGAFRPLE